MGHMQARACCRAAFLSHLMARHSQHSRPTGNCLACRLSKLCSLAVYNLDCCTNRNQKSPPRKCKGSFAWSKKGLERRSENRQKSPENTAHSRQNITQELICALHNLVKAENRIPRLYSCTAYNPEGTLSGSNPNTRHIRMDLPTGSLYRTARMCLEDIA